MQVGFCKLCGNHSKLVESHLIPKFIGKWVKNTSITGFIRLVHEAHKRAQDTAKEYLLCNDCEGLFSAWETKFANKVFFPFVDKNESVAHYEEWMSKFCASLSWRTLIYIRSKNTQNDNSKEYYETLDGAEKHLADYLIGKVKTLNQYEQHVFPLGPIESTTQSGLPTNINRYLLRTMAMDIIGNTTDLFIYTKIPSFMIIGLIKVKEPKKMKASRIALKSGKISPTNYWWPDGFINYVVEKANAVSEAHNKIPKKDLAKFEKYIKDNPEKAANSKLFEAFLYDHKQFGRKVFK
jgi:hypothetical protein